MPQNAMEETFDEITVLNKPALFTGSRLDRGTVPKGLYAYDVRHDDDCQGIPCEIAKYIMVNHWGTILLAEPLDLGDKGFLLIDEDNDWNYAPIDEKPRTLAAIEYLGTNGTVRETQEFYDDSQFKKTVKEELYYGVPLNMVIYEFGAEKHHVSMDWVSELDTLPCGMRYEAHADDRRVPCRTVQEFLQTYGQNKDINEIPDFADKLKKEMELATKKQNRVQGER